MEIFRLFESTMANVQPGHGIKHLRRDQLLDNYDSAAKTLQTLIRAKESEIAHRKDLIKMLEDSKTFHDNRLLQAKQEYQTARSHIPENVDLKSKTTLSKTRSTTPPMPPPATHIASQAPVNPQANLASGQSSLTYGAQPYQGQQQKSTPQSANKSFEADLYAHADNNHDRNRGSLDRRLSEFLKTFPNLTQTGMAAPSNMEQQQLEPQIQPQPQQQLTKPTPGYYTQQPTVPPIQMLAAPPSIELLRYPPPFFPRNDRNTN